MIPEEFVKLLRCPITHASLLPADENLLARINRGVGERRIVSRDGHTVERPMDEALVGEDGVWLYPVYDQVPALMSDAAIALDQVE